MCAMTGPVWIGGGDVGEFEQAERDDWELEKAQDKVDREHDRDYLYDFDTRVEDWEAAWRADKRRQAEANRRLLEGGDTDEWPRFW